MDTIQQQLLDTFRQNLSFLSYNNESSDTSFMAWWVHLWKMDDISTITPAQFKQQYQSRFTAEEFHQLLCQNYEQCMLCRWPTNDFLKEYLSSAFLRSAGIYVDDDYSGTLEPFWFGHHNTYPVFMLGSAQIYFVLGNSDVTFTMDAHFPHIVVRDNANLKLTVPSNSSVRIDLLEYASVTVSGSEKALIVKHDQTVTINDNTGNATVIENPVRNDDIPLNISAFRRFRDA